VLVLGVVPDSTPDELKVLHHWVDWRLRKRNGKRKKPKKVPYTPSTGRRASPTDPSTWGTYEEALQALERYDGLGVGLTEEDPFVGIDLDNCVDPETGEVAAWASEIVDALDSYTELSPSGTGLRVFAHGELPPGRRRKGDVEMYDWGRYFTITGRVYGGHATISPEDRTEVFRRLHAQHLGRQEYRPIVTIPGPASEGLTDDGRSTAALLATTTGRIASCLPGLSGLP